MHELKISNEEMRDEELNAILNGAVGEKVKTPEEYIKRSDVLKKAICLIQGPTGEEHLRFCAVPFEDIQKIPAADVVSRKQYEQIKWERDMLSDQLAARWIPATERLPEAKVDVLAVVRCKDGTSVVNQGWYSVLNERWYIGLTGIHATVTHWMPLPEPPEGGN